MDPLVNLMTNQHQSSSCEFTVNVFCTEQNRTSFRRTMQTYNLLCIVAMDVVTVVPVAGNTLQMNFIFAEYCIRLILPTASH